MKPENTLFFIIILALLLRLGAFFYFISQDKLKTWEYEDIARNLVNGQGFKNEYRGTTYYSCTTPLYPYVCAGIYKVFGLNHKAVILLQIIISLFACVVIFDIGRRAAGLAVGLVSSALYAVHPGLIVYSVLNLHPLVFDSLLLMLTLWSFMYLADALDFKRSLLAGFIAGLCVLTRSTVIAFIPFGIIWLFWYFKRSNTKKILINALLILIAMSAVVSPWVVRNFVVHREFILTTSADAEVFWRGNNKNATGTSHTLSGNVVLYKDKALYDKIASMDELEQRNYFRREGIKFVKENPKEFIGLFFKKLYYFWWFSPSSGIRYPSLYTRAYRCLYVLFVLLALAGFYGILKRRISVDFKNFLLLGLFLLSISLLQSLFYVEGRHRWGIEPVFLIISAAGIVNIFRKLVNLRKVAGK